MLLIGVWHYCPDSPYHIVETQDLEEPCENCKRQREWKRRQEEAERARQERIERERKEHRRAYAKGYREARKEREQENRRRAEQGLPPLEKPSKPPVEAVFIHNGHQFQRQKDQYGRPEVYCLKCEATWSRPPQGYCATIKTYRAWSAIPDHLKTKTQLLKLKLKPTKNQKADAVLENSFGDRYRLYDQNACVPVERKLRARRETAST